MEKAVAGGRIDPITFEIIRHRLFRVVEEAITALKRVSGSPITNEGHDLMVSLYTPEGGLLIGGVGFLHHLTGASRATKHILSTFAGDIAQDDMFLLNDSYTAALHPPDVYLVAPIHHQGKLVAFSANFVHVNDIGAIDAGGFSPRAEVCFQEGFQTPGLKLIHAGEIRKDVLNTILNMSRDPGMTSLDLRSQIAANNVAKRRMQDLIAKYGLETVEEVSQSLIDQSEALLRRRLRDLPDGRWQAREYLDSQKEGRIFTIQLTLVKQGEELVFDFEGTSEQSATGLNCTYWTAVGGVFAPLFPLLCYDITWNDGVTRPVTVKAPEGTIVNAIRPAPISIATVGALQVANNLSTIVLSKMLGASARHRRRSTAVWHGSHAHIELEVHIAEGETFVAPLTDTFGGAGGGRAFKDGVDLGGELPNLVSRWGNVENHELNLPILYLYRRTVADSGGPGKYRGGVCHEYAFTRYGAGLKRLGVVTFGKGVRSPLGIGIFGGYPGCTTDYLIFRKAGLWSEQSPLPYNLDTTAGGQREEAAWGVFELGNDDIFYVRFAGSGGYGDPLERDPELVLEDVLRGLIDAGTARDVYGVILTSDRTVESAGVEARRRLLRQDRLQSSRPARPPEGRDDLQETPFFLGEALPLVLSDGTLYVACGRCRHLVAPASENWKARAAVRESALSRAGRFREKTEPQIVLREFFCGHCATLLDTEVSLSSDPYLWDWVEGCGAEGI